ncbi:kinase-like protein [Hesseltinella vesiculosa]|uniref:non-specific serine/threonine protein kinase n=1 Tax=Hesseltinella vesiculosa TaxID=101127 RepID=A0A1X2GLM6_9FUNG|nr:kinase-like protein [Hesseltinella vesiculosa]
MPSQRPSATDSSSTATVNVVGVHYKIGRKIGEGSFGVIYQGINILNNQPVAIKFEPRKSEAPQLRDEYRSYKILAGSVGIPYAYYFGQEGLHNVLVIDLLGSSLEDLFDTCNRKFSVKTVAMLAKDMVTRLQCVHEHNLVYRDIKPDNFLMGRAGKDNILYMIDFGMAKHYRDPKTKVHIPYRERKSLSGTARYMSINTHLGREQSRRDDLESLGHVFMYFLRGSLPWQGLKAATNKQKYEKIGEKKQSTSVKDLCTGYPNEFAIYLQYVRKLGFEESPDYDFLRDLFNKVLDREGGDDGMYDWMLLEKAKQEKISQQASASQAQRVDAAPKSPQLPSPSSAPHLPIAMSDPRNAMDTPPTNGRYQSIGMNSSLSHQRVSKSAKRMTWKRFWHNVGDLLLCGGCRGFQCQGFCCTCHCECDP